MKSQTELICLLGKSPQVLTEALYFLEYKNKIGYDKIIIITTNDCIEHISKSLKKELKSFSEKYGINLTQEVEYYESIDELYLNQSSSSLTKLIFDLVKSEKLRGNTLHCVISGGRKTMSVDLAIALSIFGNDDDKMYHVIASEKFAQSKKYYPESEEEAMELFLIEKPFVRLKVSDSKNSSEVSELINIVQKEIESRLELPILEIYPISRRLVIANKMIQLQPLPFAIYLFFAKNAGKFIKGGKSFSDKHLEEIWEIYTKYSPSYGHMQRVSASSIQPGKINFELVQKSISTIRNQITHTLDNDLLSDFYIINSIGGYADKKYGIKLPKNRVKIIK